MQTCPHSTIIGVSQGDAGAFKALFECFSPKVYGYALKITHCELTAEELVQDVFLKIWLNRRSLGAVEHFPAYLFTITRNAAFNILKRLAIEQEAKAEFAKQSSQRQTNPEEAAIYGDYQHILAKAIDRLSPQQKSVYSLCHGEGLKYEEAAQKLHISRLTVKTHMQQALRAIRAHIREVVTLFIVSLMQIS